MLITISAEGTCNTPGSAEAFRQPVRGSIPTIIRSYKAAVTQRASALRDAPVAAVWHGNYYEHVARNESERKRIYLYIISNPARWDSDEENPAGKKVKGPE